MSSLVSIVSSRGNIKLGDPDGDDVLILQLALRHAGYKIATDGLFGPQTDHAVEQFQRQHGLHPDGIVGPITAAVLDAPHEVLVATAKPESMLVKPAGAVDPVRSPHDDTASLLAFYGKPWEDSSLLERVRCPWRLYYDGVLWDHPVTIHRKVAPYLDKAFSEIWEKAGKDNDSAVLRHVKHFSGSYNYRPVRGSSRLSTHAFGASLDFDAAHLPLGKRVGASDIPTSVVQAFDNAGFTWGGRFRGRPDSMHWQWAHE